ncbi:MAG: YncE family protein [Bacteroidota bacterium]|nr:YncE family protein [Bacteroidota bacterium]
MKNASVYFFFLINIFVCSGCKAQETFGENYLHLTKTISLSGVKGRIDHLDINLKDQIVYIAALGNNSVEVVDLNAGKVLHSITGLDEPQGIAYIPQTEEILVANGGSGDCYFYNARTYEKVATIHLRSDADDVRYDCVYKKIYVGYGKGGIAIIDATDHKQTGDIKLPDHPEGFQVDSKNNLLYVNLPGPDLISVADLKQLKMIRIVSENYRSGNFPMAMDSSGHTLFIGYRHPGKLAIIKTTSGHRIRVNDLTNDSDDLFYDEVTKRIYVSCGGGYTNLGYINIFQFEGGDKYKQIANIPTRNNARTSLLVPQMHLFLLAEPSDRKHEAQLLVYKIQ